MPFLDKDTDDILKSDWSKDNAGGINMKVEIETEKIDNGFIVELNGKKTFVEDKCGIADLLLGSEPADIDVPARLGRVQKDILSLIRKENYTIGQVAERLYPGYTGRQKKNVLNSVSHSFKSLQGRGLISRTQEGKFKAS
jgi:hypothetical protein